MQTTLSKFAAASVAGLAVLGSAAVVEPVQAASLGSCFTNVGLLVGNGGIGQSGFVGADDCQKSIEGNDSEADVESIFGGDWTRAFKTDAPNINSNEIFTQGNLALTYATSSESKTGTWTITGLAPDVKSFILAIKAGNAGKPGSSAQSVLYYKFNDLAVTSGDWSTFGLLNNGGQQPNLSHMTVYTQPVPTPAMLPGLIGMGVAALRKRKDEGDESAEV